jgi:hypothetical protein
VKKQKRENSGFSRLRRKNDKEGKGGVVSTGFGGNAKVRASIAGGGGYGHLFCLRPFL